MSKRIIGDNGTLKGSDPAPMRRAVAFCQTIKASQYITNSFNALQKTYLSDLSQEMQAQTAFPVSQHIDGTMASTERDEHLKWLADSDASERECRILTNARCLSEGVDVPSLDAVMFLSARNSQVDVVQSVGRVMRKAPGKKYGYIIIPVIIPSNVPADKALDNNERYKVVWTVLNALRAHDDRFNAIINKIDLNKDKSGGGKIIIGVGGADTHGDGSDAVNNGEEKEKLERQLTLAFKEMQGIFYARMVQKVGDKKYWEQWAKEVADIVERQKERIVKLVGRGGAAKAAFDEFLDGLRKNINPTTSEAEAVEMLSQHTITKPVFDALFEGYSFVEHNPISRSMQGMLDILEANAVEKDLEVLDKFYASVRKRAEGIDNAEGKQRIIIELYDKFFKMAFKKMVDRLGIVYTPVEVVDFIVKSVDDVLRKEFNRSISDENIHILDPFTGTGTFITRLLQSGLIRPKDLQRKFQHEIHANEIVLLAYYIAAVNIENVYHDLLGVDAKYEAFPGICLTDTFQLGESDDAEKLFSKQFPNNSKRVIAQKKAPLRVIMGNPPYSAGQGAANDNAQNQSYPVLEGRISSTYAKEGTATLKNSLYDSYIKAFRWSSDRLDKSGGVVCFVSNGGWLDGNAMDGFRKCLEREFSSIYVFNLRGNQRTSGELSRKEGGKIFGSGSRAPIAITLLVKNPKSQEDRAKIYYHDIGDYLSREDKLATISRLSSVNNLGFPWRTLEPNEQGDWINQRNDEFMNLFPIGDKDDKKNNTFFMPEYGRGLATSRDSWCYNSNCTKLAGNIKSTISFYNSQVDIFTKAAAETPNIQAEDVIDLDSTKFSWDRQQKKDINRHKKYTYNDDAIRVASYRPYYKQIAYFDRQINNCVYKLPSLFPTPNHNNIVICVSGVGGNKDFTAIVTDCIPDIQLEFNGQCFPLNYYEEPEATRGRLFESNNKEYVCRDGVTDFILKKAQHIYGKKVTKEDVFYYVYGLLHSLDYRTAFSSDLKKMLPRLPLVDKPEDFQAFSKAGRDLAALHLNYESIPPCPSVIVTGDESGNYHVDKMRFPKKGQKDTIIYNSNITVMGIPEKAYAYIVNGKSAVEWIMERYQITTHTESKITNDPNDWGKEVGNPRYILDLLLSVINVSVQTVDIVASLPRLNFD